MKIQDSEGELEYLEDPKKKKEDDIEEELLYGEGPSLAEWRKKQKDYKEKMLNETKEKNNTNKQKS